MTSELPLDCREFTADDILKLLCEKHAEDVVVTECKLGPSFVTSGNGRIDAWTMAKSWAHPRVCAYEVKVSRSDFLADNKWPMYLPFCNQFWFATAPGIVTAREIPPNVGWIEASKTGNRLFTRIKAPYVERTIPEELYRYLLMSRVRITREDEEIRGNPTKSQVQHMLGQKAADAHFGRLAGKRIAALVRERISEVEVQNMKLEQQAKTYDEVRAALTELGMDPANPSTWGLRQRVLSLREVVPAGLETSLNELAQGIDAALKRIEIARSGVSA